MELDSKQKHHVETESSAQEQEASQGASLPQKMATKPTSTMQEQLEKMQNKL